MLGSPLPTELKASPSQGVRGGAQDPEERVRLELRESVHNVKPMKSDANDGKHWSEKDVRNLMASLRCGDTIEEAAERLCRSGTVDEVRRKAEELGLKYKSCQLRSASNKTGGGVRS
jgi:hypothetical protein